MLTAGITAAIAGILGIFGVKPGTYLVVVAGVVKVVIVGLSVLFGAKYMKRRNQAAEASPPADPPSAL